MEGTAEDGRWAIRFGCYASRPMKIRPAMSGLTIDEAMSRVVEVTSRRGLIEYLMKNFDFWNPTDANVTVTPYGRDHRNGWDTHLICIAGLAALFSDGPCPES